MFGFIDIGLFVIHPRHSIRNLFLNLGAVEPRDNLPFFDKFTFGSQKNQLIIPVVDLAIALDRLLAFQLAIFNDFVAQRHLVHHGGGNVFDCVSTARVDSTDAPVDS